MQQVGTIQTSETAGGRAKFPSISRFGISATRPPVIDPATILLRADEVRTLLRMLGEPQTSGVILGGEPGAGKSMLAALLYEQVQAMQDREVDTPAVGVINRPLQGGIRHFVWLTLGPNAMLPDVMAAVLGGMGVALDLDGFFFLTPGQQIAFLMEALGRPGEGAFVVLDSFEELLNPETAEGLPGRGAIALFFEMLRDVDIGASRLLVTSYRSPGSLQNVQGVERMVHLRSYFVSRVSIPEGIALLHQRGVQGSHSELSLVWQRCGGHVFALILFSLLTSLSGFSLSYLLNSPDYAPMWNGEVTRNLIGTIYYYLNPIQRTLMRALCLFTEPVPLDAIATAIMGEQEDAGAADAVGNGGSAEGPYVTFQRELRALVGMCLVEERWVSIGEHRYVLHPLLRQYTVEHYLEGSDSGRARFLAGTADVSALGVAAPPNPMGSNPEARQIALAAGHMRVAAYYARLAQEYCPPREERTGLSDVEPILHMIQHLCLGWHWQEAYNLLCAEGLPERLLQWGALNVLLGLYVAMLPPLGMLYRHDFAEVCSQVGLLYGRLGNDAQGHAYVEQALSVFRELGDGYAEAVTLANEGELFRGKGEWERARRNFEQALMLNRQYGDAHLQAVVLHNLGLLFAARKDYGPALRCYVEALKLAHGSKERDQSRPYMEGMILSNMGFLLYEQGHLPEAIALLSYAVQVRQSLHDPAVSLVIDFLSVLEQKMGPEAFASAGSDQSGLYNLGTHDLITRLLSSS